MGPRNIDEPIGEFTNLAFVENKKFKGVVNNNNVASAEDQKDLALAQVQSEEYRKNLELEDKRLLLVHCNTVLINKVNHTVVMANNQLVGDVINTLSKKVAGKIQPNPDKYIILMSEGQTGTVDNENDLLSDYFGGYNAYG